MYSFEDKVVFITGSSTGIGRAAALAFADFGADVIVHYNSSQSEALEVVADIKKKGRKAIAVHGDVSSKGDIDEMMKAINIHFSKIDVLINNAGSLIKRSRLVDLDEELWDQVIDINLKSVYLVTKAVLPMMKKQQKGKIINVTSVAARNGGGYGSIAYAAAKGGVSTLTRALAKDLIEYGIIVNGIAPGVISTPFHDRFSPMEIRKKQVTNIPLGREGTPKETVGSLLFLASEYSDYIVGEIIEVNGGMLMD
ncbi:3-oxoacyl-ACP reductase family protein [Bacillaceae bacterium IKA-2]|nr:3-oxoacyl-ACP reductase family protein [Bacillaceae bacterium IKA-2]